MKRFFSILLIAVLSCSVAFAKDKKEEPLNYLIEGAGSVSGSSALVKVTIISKKKDGVDIDALERAAVHGVLFRGYTMNNGQLGGTSNQTPLAGTPDAEVKNSEFFKSFFDNSEYKSYVQSVGDSRRVIKSGKEYKISVTAEVRTGMLRTDLTKKGIIKGLGAGL